MAAAVADIGPALLDPFAPGVEVELAVGELDIHAAEPHALAVNAREVGLAGDLGPVPAVERVVPDIELPGGRGVDGRDEIDRVVDHVDDVLVGADAVERRDLVGRKLVVGNLEAPPRVREADDGPLRLAPFEHRQVPARPFLDPRRPWIVVFLEPQQAKMAGMRRRKSRDLDVIAHQVFRRRERVDLAIEELLLGVPARAPRQDAADVEVFAQDMPPHVLAASPLRSGSRNGHSRPHERDDRPKTSSAWKAGSSA